AEGQVLDFNKVQDDIKSLNGEVDRRVTPTMRAGTTPGTVDVDLVVEDHLPLHGYVELNNRHSESTSTLRAIGSLSYDNVWQRGHSLSISYQTAPLQPSDAKVIFGSYLARFRDSPWGLLFNGLRSD